MESNNEDGPHASTRHVKERRPTYHTKGARSVAALEQRIAELIGRQTLSTSPGTMRTTAAADVDAEFHNIEQTFDGLEARIATLENVSHTTDDLQTQVQSLEKRIRPYEKYRDQARTAVNQLNEVQQRVQSTGSPTKTDNTLSHQLTAQSKNIQALEERLKQAEDLAELAKAQTLSTADLGRALVHRLGRGDRLDETVGHELRAALDAAAESTDHVASSVPRDRMPETPLTDEGHGLQDANEEPVEAQERPLKRTRFEPTPQSAKKKASSANQAKTPAARQSPATSTSIKDRAALDGADSDEDTKDDVVMEETAAPTEPREPRRTGRTHKPIQHHDMLSWKDAKERMKSTRNSLG